MMVLLYAGQTVQADDPDTQMEQTEIISPQTLKKGRSKSTVSIGGR